MEAAELQSIEELCLNAYNPNNPDRTAYEQQLTNYLTDLANLGKLFSIIEISQVHQLTYLCLVNVKDVCTKNWSRLEMDMVAIHNELQGVVQQKILGYPEFVQAAFLQLLARVTKLGWLDYQSYKNTPQTLHQSMQATPALIPVVLKFYLELIRDITEPLKNRAMLQHRKTAFDFKSNTLRSILEVAVSLLESQYTEKAVELAERCLGYDFLGTTVDETSEDPTSVQFPTDWQQIVLGLPEIIFATMMRATDVTQVLCVRSVSHLWGTRKSLFETLEMRSAYVEKILVHLISAVAILEEDSFAELVLGLKRLINNFTGKDVFSAPSFLPFLDKLANVSLVLIQNKNKALWTFWHKISSESYYYYTETYEKIVVYTPGLFDAYIRATQSTLDLEKDDESPDQVGYICAKRYIESMNKLLENFAASQGPVHSAWTIFVSAHVVGVREKSERSEELDMQMMQQVMTTIDMYPGVIEVELAAISYFSYFLKFYINHYWNPHDLKDGPRLIAGIELDQIVTYVVQKITSNLSSLNDRVVSDSIDLLQDLVRGYYTGKILIQCSMQLMTNYRQNVFVSTVPDHRRRFYFCMAQMWFSEDHILNSENYLAPMTVAWQTATSEIDIITTLLDLEGILTGINTTRQYQAFFDWFYPAQFQFIFQTAEMFNENIAPCLLSFLSVLLNSKNGRIKFGDASANGILLFKESSKIMISYAKFAETQTGDKRYKNISKLLNCINCVLVGSYVQFGVFQIYNDTWFIDTLNSIFALLDLDCINFKKVEEGMYEFLSSVWKQHLTFVVKNLNPGCFTKLFELINLGLKSTNMKAMTDAATALAQICDYIIHLKPGDDLNALQQRLSENQNILIVSLQALLEIMMYEDNNYLWMISKPLLGLIIINANQYQELLQFVVQREFRDPGSQQEVHNAFTNLMDGIDTTYETKNKDKFAHNFGILRKALQAMRS